MSSCGLRGGCECWITSRDVDEKMDICICYGMVYATAEEDEIKG